MSTGSVKPRLWKIPKEKHAALKKAFEAHQFLWIVKQWNTHDVWPGGLCAACPGSVKIVKKYTSQLWQNE